MSLTSLSRTVIPMPKLIDLTGQRFGRLTVIERTKRPMGSNAQGPFWRCKCDCGRSVVVTGSNLRYGRTQSCGCLHKERFTSSGARRDTEDLTGQRFGRLTVVERAEQPEDAKTKGAYWLCRCDCGGTKIALSGSLRNGGVTSCGCMRGRSRSHWKAVYTDDGRVFPSVNRAGQAMGVTRSTLRRHIKSGKPMRNGFRVSFEPFV